MKIDVTCPQCNMPAMSKIRKVTVPGVMLVCNSCHAEIALKSMFSTVSIFSIALGMALIRLYPDTIYFWFGWLVIIMGCTYHLAKVPLKVVNPGPNYDKFNS